MSDSSRNTTPLSVPATQEGTLSLEVKCPNAIRPLRRGLLLLSGRTLTTDLDPNKRGRPHRSQTGHRRTDSPVGRVGGPEATRRLRLYPTAPRRSRPHGIGRPESPVGQNFKSSDLSLGLARTSENSLRPPYPLARLALGVVRSPAMPLAQWTLLC